MFHQTDMLGGTLMGLNQTRAKPISIIAFIGSVFFALVQNGPAGNTPKITYA